MGKARQRVGTRYSPKKKAKAAPPKDTPSSVHRRKRRQKLQGDGGDLGDIYRTPTRPAPSSMRSTALNFRTPTVRCPERRQAQEDVPPAPTRSRASRRLDLQTSTASPGSRTGCPKLIEAVAAGPPGLRRRRRRQGRCAARDRPRRHDEPDGGAGKWRSDFSERLRGADVSCCPITMSPAGSTSTMSALLSSVSRRGPASLVLPDLARERRRPRLA